MTVRTRTEITRWGLGTFHTILAILTFGVASSPGELARFLTEIATYPGAVLVGVLWMTTCWSTRRALRGISRTSHQEPFSVARILGRGFLWGGVNGVVFLLAWLGLSAVLDGAIDKLGRTIVLLGNLVFPFPLAFGIGAIVGFLCAALDLPILLLFRRVTRADLRAATL